MENVYSVSLGGLVCSSVAFFFFQAEDGIRDLTVTGVQTCALPIFPFGDGALLVTLGDRIDLALNRRVHRLARRVSEGAEASRSSGRPTWGTPVPDRKSVV